MINQTLQYSPAVHSGNRVATVMQKVLLALSPVLAFWLFSYAWAALLQMLLALVVGLLAEVFALRLRGLPVRVFINDFSTPVAMLLLALCLPPLTPWFVVVIAALVAVLLAKHSYGGLGQNIFNPAMAGYALVLVSFPQQLASWSAPWWAIDAASILSFKQSLLLVFQFESVSSRLDVITGATILADLRHQLAVLDWKWLPWLWFNGLCFFGGLLLLLMRLITWHIPVAFLLSLWFFASLFDWAGWSHITIMPIWQLGLGASMLGAFFILTDPVSAATSPLGKLLYAAFAGFLVVLIRIWGNYPDAICFAVLLANLVVPLLDHYCVPTIVSRYGWGGNQQLDKRKK